MRRLNRRNLLSLFVAAVMFITTMGLKAYGEDTTNRIWGSDSCATSIEISKSGWQDTSDYAILVTGDNYPDALCATPLAKLLNAPILLIGKPTVDPRVWDELSRLKVKKVFLIGGTGVISASVETALEKKSIGHERLYGSDRYKTSLAIANYIADKTKNVDEIAVVTGEDYPDALSIASIAGQKGMPIILSDKPGLSQDFKDYIVKRGVAKSYIIGGTGVISEETKNSLPSPERLDGADRFETNIAVLDYFLKSDEFDFGTTYLATGNNFPDALSGSVLAAKNNSPIILLDKIPGQSTLDFVASNRLLIKEMVVLGGPGAVSDSSVEPLLPRIASIEDQKFTVIEGEKYILPVSVHATMDNNMVKDVAVTWDPLNADTENGIVQTFLGNVKGYENQVKLTLIIKHPIMGKSVVSAEQMVKFLLDRNPSPQISVTPLELANLFLQEGEAEGVRGDIAFCQSIHETGWFKFGGQVLPEQNNYAGIGATNSSPVGKGAWFDSPKDGVCAQIQHLKAYASKDALVNPVIDPRYDILKQYNLLGIAPYWEDLSGRWAVPGYDTSRYKSLDDAISNGDTYGQKIFSLYKQLKNVKLN